MIDREFLQAMYVAFAFAIQILLIGNFAARNWKPELERKYGGTLYAIWGLPALILGILMSVSTRPWYFIVAPILFSVWAGFGYGVDIWRPVTWRSPPRWSILIPYVGLFVGGQLLFWGSMWYVGSGFWAAYGALYVINTMLNLYSHRRKTPAAATGQR